MKKVHVGLLGASVCLMLACGNRTAAESSGADSTFQWEGNWIEVMPVNRQYVMGISFLADGKAQSIGSATLQYEGWEVLGENDSLVLKGKSIGNGQTIDFSDTLEVVEATPERLVLGKGAANAVQYRVEYLKVEDVEAYRRKIEEEAISDGHDASNALDYQGTYRGTIPGADCPGIDVTLEVRKNGTFYLKYDYLERNTSFENTGKYRVDGNYLITVGNKNDTTYYKLEENRIRLLDGDRNVITGKLEQHYILKKVDAAGSAVAVFPEKPGRQAHEGFRWGIVEGAGLKFWAQANRSLRVVTDDELPGAYVERDGKKGSRQLALRVFPLKNGKIDDVLDVLSLTPGWNPDETGRFEERPCKRTGVKRYVLVPAGKYGENYKKQSAQEPVPVTCNGWGVGNSGMRYFEIHASHPDKAIFVEIGQDAPLFDEESIVFVK